MICEIHQEFWRVGLVIVFFLAITAWAWIFMCRDSRRQRRTGQKLEKSVIAQADRLAHELEEMSDGTPATEVSSRLFEMKKQMLLAHLSDVASIGDQRENLKMQTQTILAALFTGVLVLLTTEPFKSPGTACLLLMILLIVGLTSYLHTSNLTLMNKMGDERRFKIEEKLNQLPTMSRQELYASHLVPQPSTGPLEKVRFAVFRPQLNDMLFYLALLLLWSFIFCNVVLMKQ